MSAYGEAGGNLVADETTYPGKDGFADVFRQLTGLVRRNWRLILAIVSCVVLAAIVLTMLQMPRYTAEAVVHVGGQSQAVLGDEFDPQVEAAPSWDTERHLNTQLEILQSRGLAERVVRRLNLADDPQFLAATGMSEPAGEEQAPADRQAQIADLLLNNLKVELLRNTRIIHVGFSSTRPEMAARIANAYAEEFIQAGLQRRIDSSAYARRFISERLEEARARLEASERELNAYARRAGLIRARDPGLEEARGGLVSSSVTTSSLMQLNQAANQAEATRIAAEGRWRAEQASPPLSSAAVLGNETVQALMTRRAELEVDLEAARQRYLGDHPKVLQASAALDAVKQQLERVAQNVRNSIRADYEAALSTEQRLREEVRRLQGATLSEQDRAVRYNMLAREADTNRSIYEGLLQRFRELSASAGISTSNLAIVDRAEAPAAPSSPNLPLNLTLALLVGLGLAGIVAFTRDQLDDTLRMPEDVEEKLGVPLLGIVPDAGEEEAREALADPASPLAEAYGSLRATLPYAARTGLPRLLQVTSAQPGEGKSLSAYAIASGFARQGRKVLLVDADLRRPSVHRETGIANRHGFSSLLVSADAAGSAIVPAQEPNLDLLPSGPIPPSPTDLLTSPRAAALLDEMAEAYELVVVDSPPVLGLADAPALAALADGVVFVVEAGRGRRGALKAALRRLRAVDAVLLGGLLTKFDMSLHGGHYAEYYGYGDAPREAEGRAA